MPQSAGYQPDAGVEGKFIASEACKLAAQLLRLLVRLDPAPREAAVSLPGAQSWSPTPVTKKDTEVTRHPAPPATSTCLLFIPRKSREAVVSIQCS